MKDKEKMKKKKRNGLNLVEEKKDEDSIWVR